MEIVCMYICVYMYICKSVYVHMCTCICVYMYVCIYEDCTLIQVVFSTCLLQGIPWGRKKKHTSSSPKKNKRKRDGSSHHSHPPPLHGFLQAHHLRLLLLRAVNAELLARDKREKGGRKGAILHNEIWLRRYG